MKLINCSFNEFVGQETHEMVDIPSSSHW